MPETAVTTQSYKCQYQNFDLKKILDLVFDFDLWHCDKHCLGLVVDIHNGVEDQSRVVD